MSKSRRWGPARIGYLLGLHPSTVYKVLSRYRLARLSWLDRATGRVIRRYEHEKPGDLVTGTEANRRPSYAYLHNAVDDHSRFAYTEILDGEKKETAAGFWERANAAFNAGGITVSRVLTDNGSCSVAESRVISNAAVTALQPTAPFP